MSRMPCKFDDCRTPAPYVMDEDEAPREVCPGCDPDRDLTRKTIAAPCKAHQFPGQSHWFVLNAEGRGSVSDDLHCQDEDLWEWAAEAGQQTADLAAANARADKYRQDAQNAEDRLASAQAYWHLERKRLCADVIEAQRQMRLAVAELLHSPAARELAHRLNASPR